MSTVQIFGVPPSSYVRTARMACVEKGIDHTLEVIDFKSSEHGKLHPFLKVPAMKHGDVRLYESTAICHYIDKAFDGPPLTPSNPAAFGEMEQWISVLNCYSYRNIVVNYVLPFIRNGLDESKLDTTLKTIEHDLKLVDSQLSGNDYLVGKDLTLADLFWGAATSVLPKMPHTGKILEDCGNVRAWLDRLSKRKSVEFLFPPQ